MDSIHSHIGSNSDSNADNTESNDNKQIEDNLVNNKTKEDNKNVNKESNELSTDPNTSQVNDTALDQQKSDCLDICDTNSDLKSDENITNPRNDCEDINDSNVDNMDNNSNDNQMNSESNESNNDFNDSNDKFYGLDDEEEEDNLYNYDPTPSIAYPSVKWHSLQQLQQREYGKLIRPGTQRPINSYDSQSFRRYAYNSLYFFQRLELMAKLEEHNGCVNCLNFNTSGDRLISGSDDLRVAVWDWQRSRLVHKYHTGHSSNVFQCKWFPDEHHIVSCGRDGQIRICNVNGSTTVSNKLAQHKGAAHKLTITSEPQMILSCGEDAVVFGIDLRSGEKPTKLLFVKNETEERVPLYSIHSNKVFNPFQFVVSGRDPFIRVYDRRFLPTSDSTAIPVLTLCPEKLRESKHSVTCAQYSPSATKLLSTYNDEDIYTFDAKTGLLENSYSGHRNNATVKGCVWFGDHFIVSGSDDGYVYGWDEETQHIVMSLYADQNGVVNCIETHPTAPIMATSGLDDDVKVWVPSANEWPQTMKGIKQRICTNIKERQRSHHRLDRLGDSFDRVNSAIDAEMLYEIIRHMRRRSQRRRNGNNDNDGEDSEDTDSDSSADNGPQECIQS